MVNANKEQSFEELLREAYRQKAFPCSVIELTLLAKSAPARFQISETAVRLWAKMYAYSQRIDMRLVGNTYVIFGINDKDLTDSDTPAQPA